MSKLSSLKFNKITTNKIGIGKISAMKLRINKENLEILNNLLLLMKTYLYIKIGKIN